MLKTSNKKILFFLFASFIFFLFISSFNEKIKKVRAQITNYSSPFYSLFDTYLLSNASTNLYSSLITRNWPSNNPGKTQWTDLVLYNPQSEADQVNIKVYSYVDGSLIREINNINMPAYGFYNTYGKAEWNSLLDNNPTQPGNQTLAVVTITSNKNIVGLQRWRLMDQDNTILTPTSTLIPVRPSTMTSTIPTPTSTPASSKKLLEMLIATQILII